MRDETIIRAKLDEFLKAKLSSRSAVRQSHEMRVMLSGAIDTLKWVLEIDHEDAQKAR